MLCNRSPRLIYLLVYFLILAVLGVCYGACHFFFFFCSAQVSLVAAPVACGILVLQTGIKPASPALEGGSLTTEPPKKSYLLVLSVHP